MSQSLWAAMPGFLSGWPALTLLATFIYGFYGFGIKLSTSRGYAPAWTVMISTGTVLFLASATTAWNLASGLPALGHTKSLVLHGLGNGFFFAAGSLFAHLSLARVPGSVGFPVSKLNTVFVVLLSLAVFRETPSAIQWTAICLAVSAIAILGFSNPSAKRSKEGSSGEPSPGPGLDSASGPARRTFFAGILYGLAGAISTALSAIINKSGAMTLDRTAFIAVSYIFSTISVALLARLFTPEIFRSGPAKGQKALGITMGILNFVGFVTILAAFSKGPLSVIHPIFSTSMVISIALSTLALGERLTLWAGLAGFLVLGAVVLAKF